MEIMIDRQIRAEVIDCARTIAKHNKYPHLVNGLQPVEDTEIDGKVYKGLENKLFGEWQEFREAVQKKDRPHQLHEAADIYYYSAQLEEQSAQSILPSSLASLHAFGFEVREVETAARTKYGWRVLAPGNKHEAYEIALIEATLNNVPLSYVLNSAVLTSFGSYFYIPCSEEEATQFLKDDPFWSVIGYQETATALGAITGVEIPVNRMSIRMFPGDQALVFRLTERIEPTKKGELTPAWVREHCELGILTREQ